MLSPPINGGLDITPSTTAPGGFMATYFCDDGHDLVGNITRMCQEDGNWTGMAPTCERKLNVRVVSYIPKGWVWSKDSVMHNMSNYTIIAVWW